MLFEQVYRDYHEILRAFLDSQPSQLDRATAFLIKELSRKSDFWKKYTNDSIDFSEPVVYSLRERVRRMGAINNPIFENKSIRKLILTFNQKIKKSKRDLKAYSRHVKERVSQFEKAQKKHKVFLEKGENPKSQFVDHGTQVENHDLTLVLEERETQTNIDASPMYYSFQDEGFIAQSENDEVETRVDDSLEVAASEQQVIES